MRMLVTFHSRTGTTRKIAQAIADAADVETVVEEIRERPGAAPGLVSAGAGGLFGRPCEIEPPENDFDDFDVVVVGTPVWGFGPSGPVRARLERSNPHTGKTGFFCTMIRAGARPAFRRMARLARLDPDALMALRRKNIRRNDVGPDIHMFLEDLGLR